MRVLFSTECFASSMESGTKMVLVKYALDEYMNEGIILKLNHVFLWHPNDLHL